MIPWDAIITFIIIAIAALYIIRKFISTKKTGGGCGCSSEGGCCSSTGQNGQPGCQGLNHNGH